MGKVIVIVGPTCSGKSGLAIDIAEKINSEVISADSRQVYRHLNIGTAKPSINELKTVRHYLIDYLEPLVLFNAGMFVEQAEKIIIRLTEENKIPIVVGGSGLYIKSLIDGIINSVDSNEEIRKDLSEKRKKFGNEYLYNELKKVDHISASKMLPQNWKRVMRALEVFYISGKPIWQHFEEQKKNADHKYYQFGLEWDRAKLYQRIEKRVDAMIDAGLIDEVKSILELGYSKEI
ncbi:MAG: tRNA (adenosine(37)-N6)-dimethylallyltransferase MiaA, partial [Ignavibacteriaceae bacterium]|nr:tRNA (adenosine(37)-N6)-dimethylallyltransferase MiaA [Ignavibacteriaceae bacterium]